MISAPGADEAGRVYISSLDAVLQGVLVGSADYPIHSVSAADYFAAAGSDIVLGPGSNALTPRFWRGTFGSTDDVPSTLILAGGDDYSGVTIVDASTISALAGSGSLSQTDAQGDVNSGGVSVGARSGSTLRSLPRNA